MVKIVTNKPEVVIPPRTFTVELSEVEASLITLILGKSSPVNVMNWIRDDVRYVTETQKSAQILDANKWDIWAVYRAFRDAVND